MSTSEAHRRYYSTPAGRATVRAYQQSPAGRAAARRYRQSPKGRATRRAVARRYAASPKGCFKVYRDDMGKRRGFAFELSFEEFMAFWQKPCSYCGDPIPTIGLDRVDSLSGYTLTNVVPCCACCNRMKLDMPLATFLAHCRKIVAFVGAQ